MLKIGVYHDDHLAWGGDKAEKSPERIGLTKEIIMKEPCKPAQIEVCYIRNHEGE